ncbi:MAG: radical SAM protein [Ruminococcus sp.]|nr:radical SAM protein [Ruminococcus sp.]
MEHLTIYMGSRCNLNCAYCHREESDSEGAVSDALLDYVRGRRDIHIKFIGGEPTLYIKEIEQVVQAAPGAEYSIITNGVELDKYIDYFRKHKFLLCISYDGTEESLRGFDPFTKVIDYPYLAVSCTLYHGNTDFKKIIRNFAAKERIIGRQLLFFPHIVHHTNDDNKKYALTEEDYDAVLAQYKDCIVSFIADYRRGVINMRYEGLFNQLASEYYAGYEMGETYCNRRGKKKTDAAGQQYSCLYIRDELLNGNWQEKQAEIIRRKFPKCVTCPVYSMCGAACIKSASHDLECAFYFRLYNWFKKIYEAEVL